MKNKQHPSDISAVDLIKYLNGRRGWHGSQYRSLCGSWLEKQKLCECETFRNAKHACSDNEGYGALIREWGGSWKVGCELPPMVFCPWCGLKLSPPNA